MTSLAVAGEGHGVDLVRRPVRSGRWTCFAFGLGLVLDAIGARIGAAHR